MLNKTCVQRQFDDQVFTCTLITADCVVASIVHKAYSKETVAVLLTFNVKQFTS